MELPRADRKHRRHIRDQECEEEVNDPRGAHIIEAGSGSRELKGSSASRNAG